MEDITQELRESAALKVHVAETQGPLIQAMLECMWESLRQGGPDARRLGAGDD